VPLPGRSYRQAPIRNLFHNSRRTLLTSLGIAAAIATLVTTVGFLDTFVNTLDRTEADLLRRAPERVSVSLRALESPSGPTVTAVRGLPQVGSVAPGVLAPTTALRGSRSVELVTEVLGPDAPWTPQVVRGATSGGIVVAQKAASDLGARVGDTITLQHPEAVAGEIRLVDTPTRIAGIHPNPLRALSYVDVATARSLGIEGVTNLLTVQPAAGATPETVRRALLGVPGVGSAEAARTTTEGMRSSLDEYLSILRVAAAVTLLLALLIAFNTTSIAMDERRREHATMLAFGLPLRTIVGLATIEAALIGLVGSVAGVIGGRAILEWVANSSIPDVMPEIGVTATLSFTTIALAVTLGVVAVAAAPALTVRRLRHLDIPSALRIVE